MDMDIYELKGVTAPKAKTRKKESKQSPKEVDHFYRNAMVTVAVLLIVAVIAIGIITWVTNGGITTMVAPAICFTPIWLMLLFNAVHDDDDDEDDE